MRIRLSFIAISLLLPLIVFAQKDVTTFLGIPVDGYRSEMRKKIIAKGFTPNKFEGTEYFEGEFNGTDVHLYIGTNNNKVYRIMLSDVKTRSEAEIIIRFNNLIYQFKKNERYISILDESIPDGEDISYEMMVNNKVYDAHFYQKPDYNKVDTVALQNQIQQRILSKYSQEELDDPSEEQKEEILQAALEIEFELLSKKLVWFRICELYGEYYITMYYDNEYNHADGEDL